LFASVCHKDFGGSDCGSPDAWRCAISNSSLASIHWSFLDCDHYACYFYVNSADADVGQARDTACVLFLKLFVFRVINWEVGILLESLKANSLTFHVIVCHFCGRLP
jgi:hypothetical protein